MGQLFMFLYPLVMIISTAGYFSQILALIKADGPHDRISLTTWWMWVSSGSISLGYGVFCLHDTMFIITAAVGLTLTVAITGMVLYNRHIRFRNRPLLPTANPVAICPVSIPVIDDFFEDLSLSA